MSYSNAYPTLCYSIKPYKSNALTNGSAEQSERSKRMKRAKDINRFGRYSSKRFGKGQCYGHMLCSIRFDNDFSIEMNKRYESFLSGTLNEEKDEDSQIEYMINQSTPNGTGNFAKPGAMNETQREREKAYNPYYIDDPRLRQARKTVITKLGPMYTFSVIRYANQKTLKNELNEDFAESHPWIPPSLTLSKIRNLKRGTSSIGRSTIWKSLHWHWLLYILRN